jgi:hypothetical protein
MPAAQPAAMTTLVATPDPRLTILRALLLVQAGTFVAGILEGIVFGAVLGPTGLTGAALGAIATAVVLVARARVPGRRATRVLVLLEGAIVAGWAIELLLGVLLAGLVPPLMAWLARLVLPGAAVVLARALAREAAARQAADDPAVPMPPPPPTRWVLA